MLAIWHLAYGLRVLKKDKIYLRLSRLPLTVYIAREIIRRLHKLHRRNISVTQP